MASNRSKSSPSRTLSSKAVASSGRYGVFGNQPLYLLYLLWNTNLPRTHIHTGHSDTFPALPGAFSNSKPKLFQRPKILSQVKILILAKQRMYLCPVWANTSLTPVAGNRRIFLFQHGQHLLKSRERILPFCGIPSHCLLHLLPGSKADQHAGNRICQYGTYQSPDRKSCRKKPCRIYLVDKKSLSAK